MKSYILKSKNILTITKMKNLLLFLFCLIINCKQTLNPISIDGILDLSKVNFENSSGIKMDGVWEFYWNRIPLKNETPDLLVKIPSTWDGLKIQDIILDGKGHASYKIKLIFDEKEIGKHFAIKIISISPAYSLYIDNVEFMRSGIVGDSKQNSFPKTTPYAKKFQLNKKEISIIVHTSNYIDYHGGIWESILIGEANKIYKERENNIALELLVTGSLFILAIYHISIFILRRKELSPIYYAVFCILMGIRSTINGEKFFINVFPDLPYLIRMKIEFFTYYAALPFLLLFLHSVFKIEFKLKILKIFIFSSIPFIFFCIFADPDFISKVSVYYHLISISGIIYILIQLILAIKNKTLGSRTFLIGMIIFSIAVINDILHNFQIINTSYISSYGFIVFIFSQSLLLSKRFSSAYLTSENLARNLEVSNNDLTQLKEELEMKVKERTNDLEIEKNKSEDLLQSILPSSIAKELKENGFVKPISFESATVMFTDFIHFTSLAEKIGTERLVKELDGWFTHFDKIIERYNLEKLKTIGDSYMCAGGIPESNFTHPIDSCLAALEIIDFIHLIGEIKKNPDLHWKLRIGIHTGSLMAGVVGEKKFAYDVWGDTVNIASRMESSSEEDRINISSHTYSLVQNFFDCEYRGKILAKNKGEIDMYFLNGLKEEYRKQNSNLPNQKFYDEYKKFKTF